VPDRLLRDTETGGLTSKDGEVEDGQAAGVRAPDLGGARHPVRTPVVHGRAGLPQVRRRGPGGTGTGLRRGHRLRRLRDRGLRPRVRVRH